MSYKVPGLTSLVIMSVALVLADYQLFLASPWLGGIYLVCIPLAFLNTLYLYCRQCPHVTNNTCRHVILGWVVAKFFTPIPPAPYRVSQLILALLPLAAVFVFPQPWLWQDRVLFVAFWVCAIAGGVIVLMGVCRSCENTYCPGCPKRAK